MRVWGSLLIIYSLFFAQLQKFDNVKQFSPLTKKHIVEKTPKYTLLTHVLKGDTSDGVPNVLSNDDVFVEGLRQTPVSAKKLDAMIQELESFGDDTPENPPSWYRNYQRNT